MIGCRFGARARKVYVRVAAAAQFARLGRRAERNARDMLDTFKDVFQLTPALKLCHRSRLFEHKKPVPPCRCA